MLRTELTDLLGLKVPVIGAPMAGVAGADLAAAVSRAGALGMLGVGSATPASWLREQAGAVADAGQPYGVGLMSWALPDRPDLLDAACGLRPALVSLSFGDPAPYVPRLRDAGIRVASQVNTVADARQAMAAGVDLLVAQGAEAGGHTGHVATLPLLQEVLDVSDRPVLAAGGIATGRGLAAVLAAGAAGAWVGTALVASPESANPPAARARVVAARAEDTVYTPVFDVAQAIPWPDRWHGRALTNAFTDRWHGRADELRQDPSAAERLRAARRAGDFDTAYVYAGQASGLVRAEVAAGEVVQRMVTEAEQLLRGRVPGLVAKDGRD